MNTSYMVCTQYVSSFNISFYFSSLEINSFSWFSFWNKNLSQHTQMNTDNSLFFLQKEFRFYLFHSIVPRLAYAFYAIQKHNFKYLTVFYIYCILLNVNQSRLISLTRYKFIYIYTLQNSSSFYLLILSYLYLPIV